MAFISQPSQILPRIPLSRLRFAFAEMQPSKIIAYKSAYLNVLMFLYSNRETIALASKYDDIKSAKAALIGVPFDSTETNIPGQRFGPKEIRAQIAKSKIELNSVYDAGDVDVVFGNAKATLKRTEDIVREIFSQNQGVVPITLGGEHTISYAAVKVLAERHKNLQVVSLDAHYDLYPDYIGEKWSHATVMLRIFELGVDLKIIGVREKNEGARNFVLRNKICIAPESINPALPTYLSVDLDFFDPKLAPGVGDPEKKGFSFDDFKNIVARCRNIVGADIVELNPMIEKKKTGAMATKCIDWLIGRII